MLNNMCYKNTFLCLGKRESLNMYKGLKGGSTYARMLSKRGGEGKDYPPEEKEKYYQEMT